MVAPSGRSTVPSLATSNATMRTHGHVDPSGLGAGRCERHRTVGRGPATSPRPGDPPAARAASPTVGDAPLDARPYRPWCDVDRTTEVEWVCCSNRGERRAGAARVVPHPVADTPLDRPRVLVAALEAVMLGDASRFAELFSEDVEFTSPHLSLTSLAVAAARARRAGGLAQRHHGRGGRPRRRRRQADRRVAARGDVHAPGAARRPRAHRADRRRGPPHRGVGRRVPWPADPCVPALLRRQRAPGRRSRARSAGASPRRPDRVDGRAPIDSSRGRYLEARHDQLAPSTSTADGSVEDGRFRGRAGDHARSRRPVRDVPARPRHDRGVPALAGSGAPRPAGRDRRAPPGVDPRDPAARAMGEPAVTVAVRGGRRRRRPRRAPAAHGRARAPDPRAAGRPPRLAGRSAVDRSRPGVVRRRRSTSTPRRSRSPTGSP